MFKKSICLTVLAYGTSLMSFGVAGYLRSGSMISMITGGIFGFLMILTSLFMFGQKRGSGYVALLLSLLITAAFVNRYLMSGKTFPALFAVISGALFGLLLTQVRGWRAMARIDPKSS